MESPSCRREGALTPGWCVVQFLGDVTLSAAWTTSQTRSETLAWLTYCLHLLTHSCTAFFFLVPWICWFLSLLLGLCPRHCIISLFVFGSRGGGRYLHLDTNVNIIHPQVNNSDKIEGPDPLQGGREGCEMLLSGQGHPQHHCLGLGTTTCVWSYCRFRSCPSPPSAVLTDWFKFSLMLSPVEDTDTGSLRLTVVSGWEPYVALLTSTAELLGPRCPAFPRGVRVIKGPAYRPPRSWDAPGRASSGSSSPGELQQPRALAALPAFPLWSFTRSHQAPVSLATSKGVCSWCAMLLYFWRYGSFPACLPKYQWYAGLRRCF